MSKKRFGSSQVAEPPPQTWSNCVVMGRQFFVAGQTASDRQGGVTGGDSMYEQSKAVLTKIKHLVEAAGGKMDDIMKVTIFVTDIKQREEVWKARREFFTGDFPASTLVEISALATPAQKVEIEAAGVIGAAPPAPRAARKPPVRGTAAGRASRSRGATRPAARPRAR
ncbi:MAG: RidA family protein [Alphaproteobacteria bacterium]|nr:RidA family protein [Alphaproteobacteria bacterium]